MWPKPDGCENFFVSCLKATGIDGSVGQVPCAPDTKINQEQGTPDLVTIS